MKKSNPIVSMLIFGITVLAIFTIIRNSQPLYSPSVNVSAESSAPSVNVSDESSSPSADAQANADALTEAVAPLELIGEVTVTNIDAENPDLRLAGAIVQILSLDSDVSYVENIGSSGVYTFNLPLGKYALSQLSSAESYELDKSIYEFELSIPEDTDASMIKAIQANVVLKNKKVEAPIELVATENANAEKPAVSNLLVAVPNPVTGDSSFFMGLTTAMVITGALAIIMLVMIVVVFNLKRRIKLR